MGGRVEYVAPDISHIRVRLALTRYTRNMLGSLFGGSLFGITDGPLPTMLMWALGGEYIVWDKAASIRYRKPGRTTLYADFRLSTAEIESIRARLSAEPEIDCCFPIEIKDEAGAVYSTVERMVYIAHKNHYRQKTAKGDNK